MPFDTFILFCVAIGALCWCTDRIATAIEKRKENDGD